MNRKNSMTEMTPTIDKRKRVSAIWIIPIVALLLGLGMVIHTKLSEGPTITISFKTAEGLVAGKTKVEYLNVEVGEVQAVDLNTKKAGVIVTVQLRPEAKHLLKKETEFWVVRARIGTGNISGLSTLMAGAYIELSPGETEIHQRVYIGLETPPLTPEGAPGVTLDLYSEQAGSVSVGDFVLYHGYKVGRIEGMGFDRERLMVHYNVFINAPFDQLVTSSVRFWNVSGISVDASADGIEVKMGAMVTVLLGGVAFEAPTGLPKGDVVANGTDFTLYDSYAALQAHPYRHAFECVMAFEQSLRGLVVGAPVEYRGIPVGHVKRLMSDALMADRDDVYGVPIPVLITIEPGRMNLPDTAASVDLLKQNLTKYVVHGLRGSLATGNLITGRRFINVDYHKDAKPAELGELGGYPEIPTIETGFERIESQVSKLLTKLNALPLDDAVTSSAAMMAALTKTLDALDAILSDQHSQQLTGELTETLQEFRKILASLAPGESTFRVIESSVDKLNETLGNLEELTRTLKDKPNALVFPTHFPEDPLPGGKR
jgi:paraquat-inducible protein B